VLLAAVGAAIVATPYAGVAIDRLGIVAAVVVITAIVVPIAIAVAVPLPGILDRRRAIAGGVEIERRGGKRGHGQARSDQGQGSLCNEGFHGLGSYQTASGRLIPTPGFLNGGQLARSEMQIFRVACSARRPSLTLRR